MPWFEADDTLPTIGGRALGFGLVLAVEQILDPAVPDSLPSTARLHLFAAIDPNLSSRLTAGDVIVAEEIADAEYAANRALSVLAEAGVVALVAKRFAASVPNAAATVGILALVVDTPNILRTGDRLRIDLDAGKVVDLSSGDRVAIRNATDPADRARLRTALARSTT